MSDDCYWYSQGQCFLTTKKLPKRWILEFIEEVPKARQDVLECPGQKCPDIDTEFKEHARTAPSVKSAKQKTDEFMQEFNRFIDHDHERKGNAVKRLSPEEEKDSS